jgi:hypothetical protein
VPHVTDAAACLDSQGYQLNLPCNFLHRHVVIPHHTPDRGEELIPGSQQTKKTEPAPISTVEAWQQTRSIRRSKKYGTQTCTLLLHHRIGDISQVSNGLAD